MVSAEENGIWACTVAREELSNGAFYEPVGEFGVAFEVERGSKRWRVDFGIGRMRR